MFDPVVGTILCKKRPRVRERWVEASHRDVSWTPEDACLFQRRQRKELVVVCKDEV